MEVNSCLLVNELKSANFGDTQVETPNGTRVAPSFASENRPQVVRLSEKRRRVSGGHFAHLHQYEGKTILGQGSKFLTCLWRLKSSPTFIKRKPSMDLKVIPLNKKPYFRNWLKQGIRNTFYSERCKYAVGFFLFTKIFSTDSLGTHFRLIRHKRGSPHAQYFD